MASLSGDVMRRIRHFGDFVTVPLAILIFANLAGVQCLHLVVAGFAAWTMLEYLVHRFVFHQYSWAARLHELHHAHPNDPDSEQSSLSRPLLAEALLSASLAAPGFFAGATQGFGERATARVRLRLARWLRGLRGG